MRLLDADVLIDLQRGFPAAMAWYASLAEPVSIPIFAALELLQNARDKRELDRSLRHLRAFTVVYATEADQQRAFASFQAHHLASGISSNDCLIAATAIGLGATLVTFNLKHYQHIPGLVIEQPYTR